MTLRRCTIVTVLCLAGLAVSAGAELKLPAIISDNMVIQADRDARTGVLVQVMDAARQAGVYDVAIAADNGGP